MEAAPPSALDPRPEGGLTSEEIEARRKQHGYNEVVEQPGHPLRTFLGKFWGLSAWMLELIMLLSLVLRHYFELVVVGGIGEARRAGQDVDG